MTEYDIGEAFKAIEDELIASMMRNMDRHKREEDAYGFNWPAWQAEQLKALERYRVANQKKFNRDFIEINRSVETLIKQARKEGGMKEEIRILKSIQKGYKVQGGNAGTKRRKQKMTAGFFKSNDRKLNALIKATTYDLKKAETAMLRMADDQYRKIIFNAQVYANTGAGTYKQAVDMASKDFLRAGINCIEYKNGARHTIKDYAAMAIRTANKRAALMGAGEKRAEWGIHTVIVNNRAAPCEKCLPFVGVVFIDDVYSGGSRKDGDYPLLSTAIAAGLFHPNCKDGTSTYYPGITPIPSKYTKSELEKVMADARKESRQKYAAVQAEKLGRMAKYSLDEDNKKKYSVKREYWDKVKNIYDTILEHDPKILYELEDIHKNTIIHMIGQSDILIQNCTLKYLDKIKFINEKALGRAVSTKDGIRVNLKNDMNNRRGKYTSTFHEMGHAIDRAGGGLSHVNPNFKNALINDFGGLVNLYVEEYNIDKLKVYELISKEMLTDDRHSISDIIGGITENECVGKYLHELKYWKKQYSLEAEAFAHFYEAFARGDTQKIKYLSEIFPNATIEFKRLLE